MRRGRDSRWPGSPRRCARTRTGGSRPTACPAGCPERSSMTTPVFTQVLLARSNRRIVKSVDAASYMLAHHDPSFHQSLLSGLVSVGSTTPLPYVGPAIPDVADCRRRRRRDDRGRHDPADRDEDRHDQRRPRATPLAACPSMVPPCPRVERGTLLVPLSSPVGGQMSIPWCRFADTPPSGLIRTPDRRATPARSTDRSR